MAERLTTVLTTERRTIGKIDLANKEDPVVDFIDSLESSLERLKRPLSWTMSHNRRRSISGMAIAKDQREHQLTTTTDALKILKSGEVVEATFFKNEDGKIVGFRIDGKIDS